MPCLNSKTLFQALFHLGYSLLAPVSAHNGRLFAPCSQLRSISFRAYSPWAGKESLLSLEGRVFTYIPTGVQFPTYVVNW
jgi:hypothetical protein